MLSVGHSRQQILVKLQFSLQIFEKHSNIIFHENRPNGSRVVVPACGQTDMTVANVAFRNFAKSAYT